MKTAHKATAHNVEVFGFAPANVPMIVVCNASSRLDVGTLFIAWLIDLWSVFVARERIGEVFKQVAFLQGRADVIGVSPRLEFALEFMSAGS
ncbi:MAG TPA: hypothetical protein PKA41_11100 [Verrucomicrobiota bacterium]|nr:hypothetical protein [Verrucomicrobiota bacterium]